jgi:hypothetical protein
MENPKRDISGKKCITIFIQAHGEVITGSIIPEDLAKSVSILNFPGGVDRYGTMEASCPPVKISHNKYARMCDVKLYGPQLDMMVLEYIHHVYSQTNKLSLPSVSCLESQHALKVINDGLPLVYANKGIPYFHGITNDEVMSEPTEPFVIHIPYNDKNYTLHPSLHEDCSSSPDECSSGHCTLLDSMKQLCPEYGITIVHSSNNDDLAWTLAGIPEGGDLLTVNLNQSEGHESFMMDEDESLPSTYTHWKNKITTKYFIRQRALRQQIGEIKTDTSGKYSETRDELLGKYNYELTSLNSESKQKIGVYDNMTRVLNRDIPISMQDELLPKTTLSDIIDIFINCMGYDHLYIIDPSCNYCDVEVNKKQIQEIDEATRLRSGLRPSYKKVFNNPTDISIRDESEKIITGTRKRARSFGGRKCKVKNKNKGKNKTKKRRNR